MHFSYKGLEHPPYGAVGSTSGEAPAATEPALTLADVQAVAAAHRVTPCGHLPNSYGPRDQGRWDDRLGEVEHACAFIRAADRPMHRKPMSSYWWKHEAERWRDPGRALGRRYVSNGAFIIAAILEDLKPRRIFYVDDAGRRLTINSTIRLP